MKQPRQQPQPRFFVNEKPFTKEAEALTEVEVLKTAFTPTVTFIDVKAKKQRTYTLNRKNYFVNESVYTPAQKNQSIANSSNDRDNADSLSEVQETVE